MTRRRPLPPGIDRLPSGRLRARYRDDNGRPYSATFPGLREAERWLRERRVTVDRGSHYDPTNPTTVAQVATRWLKHRSYRPASATRVRTHIQHITDSRLGRMRVVDVLPSDVQEWIASTAAPVGTLGPQSLHHAYRYLKAIFLDAVEDRLIQVTPCTSRISLPRIERSKVKPLTMAEIAALTAGMPERYRILITLQAGLGLRIGEALALQVRDVDFLRGTVTVDRQIDQHRTYGPPKSRAGYRTLPLPGHVRDALAAHLQLHGTGEDDVILSTAEGLPCRADYIGTHLFREAAHAAGLPREVTPHTLRHTYASLIIEGGCSAVVAARLLGHEDPAITLRVYSHFFEGADDKARGILDTAFAREKTDVALHA